MIYYLESLSDDIKITERGFNLWAKKGNKYYGLATLFVDDWNVSDISNSITYSEKEIWDELENPLVLIKKTWGEKLITMKNNSPTEIISCIPKWYRK